MFAGQRVAGRQGTVLTFVGTFENHQLCHCCEYCPEPTGACCFDIDCSDVPEADCSALGGEYNGDGSFCNGDPAPCAPEPCEGDVDGDGDVDVSDILTVIGNWGCSQ